MDIFDQWVFLAFIVERLSEYLGKLIPAIEKLENQFVNTKLCIAFAISLMLAFGAGLDFFTAFEINFRYAYVGIILTAVFLSGGSNAVHDILGFVRNLKSNSDPIE